MSPFFFFFFFFFIWPKRSRPTDNGTSTFSNSFSFSSPCSLGLIEPIWIQNRPNDLYNEGHGRWVIDKTDLPWSNTDTCDTHRSHGPYSLYFTSLSAPYIPIFSLSLSRSFSVFFLNNRVVYLLSSTTTDVTAPHQLRWQLDTFLACHMCQKGKQPGWTRIQAYPKRREREKSVTCVPHRSRFRHTRYCGFNKHDVSIRTASFFSSLYLF